MKRNFLIACGVIILAALVCGGVYVFRQQNSHDSHKLTVVAAENFWGDIAAQIGGDKVRVGSIMSDPSADPHLYESNARDAARLARADVVVTNGLGYDDFMDKLLGAAPNPQRETIVAADVMGVHGTDANPHLWYDIPRVQQVARAIEQKLAAKDSADQAVFAANLKKFNASLAPLNAKISEIKTKYPHAPVAYTERVPGYLLNAAGLDVKTPPSFASAIEAGNDPSPADQHAMEQLLTGKKIRALPYNAQATSPVTQHVRELARQNDIPIVGVTETMPKNAKNYQAWQGAQLDALLQALENKSNEQ